MFFKVGDKVKLLDPELVEPVPGRKMSMEELKKRYSRYKDYIMMITAIQERFNFSISLSFNDCCYHPYELKLMERE